MILLQSTGDEARVLTYAPHIIPFFLLFLISWDERTQGHAFFFFASATSAGTSFQPLILSLSHCFFLTTEDVFFICIKETRSRCSFTYSHYFFLSIIVYSLYVSQPNCRKRVLFWNSFRYSFGKTNSQRNGQKAPSRCRNPMLFFLEINGKENKIPLVHECPVCVYTIV
jgi:hypothetical protein